MSSVVRTIKNVVRKHPIATVVGGLGFAALGTVLNALHVHGSGHALSAALTLSPHALLAVAIVGLIGFAVFKAGKKLWENRESIAEGAKKLIGSKESLPEDHATPADDDEAVPVPTSK